MRHQKGFTNIILIIIVIALIGAGTYLVLNRKTTPPQPIACTQEAKQCPDGSYVGRTGSKCEFAPCPSITPAPNNDEIIKKVGEQEGSFLIQTINTDSVDGLWYQAYPVARNIGTAKTLHLGDNIGYTCEGVSEKLTNIDFLGQTVTFTKVIGQRPFGGCPICLAGNTLIDTPSGAVPVKNMRVGMPIWTIDKSGERVPAIILKTSKVPVPPTHQMVHLILDDGRELLASPEHPTIDGRSVGDLKIGNQYDGATITKAQRVPYNEDATYDVLPTGETGFYWANGILLSSTLH